MKPSQAQLMSSIRTGQSKAPTPVKIEKINQDISVFDIVNSLVIQSVQHQGEYLRVVYHNGSQVEFDDVSFEQYKNLVKAEMPASYLVRHIMVDREGVKVTPLSPIGSGWFE